MNKWLFNYTCILCLGCTYNQQKQADVNTLKLKASEKMQEKVNHVLQQLHADCDSTLLMMAKQKVDSIKQSRKNKQSKATKKKNQKPK